MNRAVASFRRAQEILVLSAAVVLAGCQQQPQDLAAGPRREGSRTSALTGDFQFVQVAYATPQSNSSTVAVKFAAAQTAGNLNVVVVGWNDTAAAVSAVTDSKGNNYALAIGPTAYPGALSQSIYYAKNIAGALAGANTVTVTFTRAAIYADIRILEYAGVDPSNPIDVVAGASGTAGTASSGAITTTNAGDLLFGANMTTGCTNGPGTSFTMQVITQPDCDGAEDRKVTTVGSYAATMSVSSGSPWVMQMVAFRGAPSDAQPPTAPASLSATASSSSPSGSPGPRRPTTWASPATSSSAAPGAAARPSAQIGTAPATATSFTDSGLTPSTSYGYRVRANDAAGNYSPYSTIATATTLPDSTPPTAPATLSATAVGSTRVDLSWAAATDNVAVTGYLVERCTGNGCSTFSQIAAPTGTGTTFSDTTATAGTTYGYRVRATDATGNLGPYSPVATATTPTPDTTPPSAPSGLQAAAASNSQINLSWTAAADNVAVTGYLIERCQGSGCSSFTQIAAPAGTGTTYADQGLATSTAYSYQVRATDAAGNLGPYSAVASATTLASAPPPVVPRFIQSAYATPQSAKTSVPITFTRGAARRELQRGDRGLERHHRPGHHGEGQQGQHVRQGHRPDAEQLAGPVAVHLLRGEHRRGRRRGEHRHRHLLAGRQLRGHPDPRVQRSGHHRAGRCLERGQRLERHRKQRGIHHHPGRRSPSWQGTWSRPSPPPEAPATRCGSSPSPMATRPRTGWRAPPARTPRPPGSRTVAG